VVKKYYTQLSAAVLFAMSAGASIVSAQGSPNPAHAHIGHVMTSWKDTPDCARLPTNYVKIEVPE